jgi:predicted RNase H-like HicB family nuclease
MRKKFTMEYWIDDGWYVGRLKEVPGVFSQGETLKQLKANVRDAYQMMIEAETLELPSATKRKEVDLEL